MASTVRAEWDPRLSARVVSRRPLFYSDGPDPSEDRPAHVRAGSGIAFLDGLLAVIQDDANFVALINPTTWKVESVALPRSSSGTRQFDDDRGNKADKLDLEACVTLSLAGEPTLVAFGSGSTRARERIALVRVSGAGVRDARLLEAPALYAALRACREFSGSELNVEGAVLSGDRIWFVQRGNGEARDGRVPTNATASLPTSAVTAVLRDGLGVKIPEPEDVATYDLGVVASVPLTFTDATSAPAPRERPGERKSDRALAMVYLAAAEASPDATRDGPVAGAALGIVSSHRARSVLLTDEGGAPLIDKTEGIVLDPADDRRAWVVVDADDASKPCELCEVRLDGPWW